MSYEVIIRGVYVAALVFAGLFALRRRDGFGKITRLFCPGPNAPGIAERLAKAIEEREKFEDLPKPALALWLAAASFAAACAFATLPLGAFGYVYAVYVLVCAAAAAAGALISRNRPGKRAAPLRRRDPRFYAPWWMRTLVCIAVVSPLAFIDVSPLQALIVTVAGVMVCAAGALVVSMPSRLDGDDPEIEAFIDDRLRRFRTAQLFALAPIPALVFESLSAYWNSPLYATAFASVALALGAAAFYLVRVSAPVGLVANGTSRG